MQRARKFLKLRFRMPVSVSVVVHVMIVPVRVSYRMRVRCSVVRVREGVLMNMRVVLYQRIDHNERRACRHHDQRDDISPSDLFTQKHESKEKCRRTERPRNKRSFLPLQARFALLRTGKY